MSRPVRGTVAVEIELPWRLDGATSAADAPLVLALHGQSMDQDRLALLLQDLFDLPMHCLLPRAPWPIESRSRDRIGWSWYPYDGDQERFQSELARTEAMLLQLLATVEQRQGLHPRQRILFGFSQGGYCGAVIALRHVELFAGLVVAGARVKTEILGDALPRAAASRLEVLLLHGLRDVAVLPEAAERGRDALRAAGVAVELQTFDAGHVLGRAQVAALRRWLIQVLGLPV